MLFLVLSACLATPTMSDSTNLKETLFIHKQKINLIPQFFLEILHYEESCNLISLILIDNFRTRISQDIGFAMESQEFKGISFCIVFRKNKRQHLKKKRSKKYRFWTLFTQIWARRNFHKNRAPSLFSIYSFLTSCKKSEKTNEPILSKPTNE